MSAMVLCNKSHAHTSALVCAIMQPFISISPASSFFVFRRNCKKHLEKSKTTRFADLRGGGSRACACVCVCVCACVRACVRAGGRAGGRACVRQGNGGEQWQLSDKFLLCENSFCIHPLTDQDLPAVPLRRHFCSAKTHSPNMDPHTGSSPLNFEGRKSPVHLERYGRQRQFSFAK